MLVGCSLTVPCFDSMFSLTNHQMRFCTTWQMVMSMLMANIEMLMLHADLIFQVFDSVDDEGLVSLEDELPPC